MEEQNQNQNPNPNQVNEEEKSKKKKYLLLLLLLLLLFIVLIFWHTCLKQPSIILGEKEENDANETNTTYQQNNNTNNINDTITDNGSTITNNRTNNSTYNTTNNGISNQEENTSNTENPEETNPEIKEIEVTSKGEKISETLTIFDKVKYNGEPSIYPSIKDTYNFEVKNTMASNIVCEVSFDEQNIEELPIKYRLKENGKYIKGNENTYVSYNELKFERQMKAEEQNKYELEWEWLEGENDNKYGDVNKTITYQLQLTVTAKDN